jgi:hypothetical protein
VATPEVLFAGGTGTLTPGEASEACDGVLGAEALVPRDGGAACGFCTTGGAPVPLEITGPDETDTPRAPEEAPCPRLLTGACPAADGPEVVDGAESSVFPGAVTTGLLGADTSGASWLAVAGSAFGAAGGGALAGAGAEATGLCRTMGAA